MLSQDTELSAPCADVPPLGHESVALEKLLSLPERQQLEEAGAGLLLWEKGGKEEEEEQRKVGERGGEGDTLMAPRQRSEGDRKKRDGGGACRLLVDTSTGVGGRSGSELNTDLTPPALALSPTYSHSPPR